MTSRSARLVVLDGLTSFDAAHALQLETVEKRIAGAIPDTLIMLEHQPVVTLGRNADPAGIKASFDELKRLGVSTFRVERGGQATYHGPGQVVGYPIFDLRAMRLGAAKYVFNLEETMIRAARSLGVEAFRRKGSAGVFTGAGKIGAIGVRITCGVSFHGFSFNADPDLNRYGLIVPCGEEKLQITSMSEIKGEPVAVSEAREALVESFGSVFCVQLVPHLESAICG